MLHLQDWMDEVQKLTTDEPVKLVIANKSDLENKKVSESDMLVSILICYLKCNKLIKRISQKELE